MIEPRTLTVVLGGAIAALGVSAVVGVTQLSTGFHVPARTLAIRSASAPIAAPPWTMSSPATPATSPGPATPSMTSVPATTAPPTTTAPATAAPTADNMPPLTYTVKTGDNLSTIAAWFKLHGYQALYQANESVIGNDPNLIFPGQTITIGAGGATMGQAGR